MNEIEQLQEAIKNAQAKLDALKSQNKFEVGKWYKSKHSSTTFRIINDKYCQGLRSTGEWYDDAKWHVGANFNDFTLATPSEIESALIAEAKRRGFKEGVRFKQKFDYDSFGSIVAEHTKEGNVSGNLYLFPNSKSKYNLCSKDGNVIIFRGDTGQWAEIISEPKIEIGGYEVMFPTQQFNGINHVTIDGHSFNKLFWQDCVRVASHGKAAVYVGCGAKSGGNSKWVVPIETINAILAKI